MNKWLCFKDFVTEYRMNIKSKINKMPISHFRYPFPSSSGGFTGRFNLVIVLRRPLNHFKVLMLLVYLLLQSNHEPYLLEAASAFIGGISYVKIQSQLFNLRFLSAFNTFLIDLNDSGVPWPLKRSI